MTPPASHPVTPPALVLASASPRRRQLLAEHGYRAETFPVQVEESNARWLTVRELVLLNARRKASAVAAQRPGALALGADTLVCLDDEPLGKPRDLDHARSMLTRLSGREHQVYSGVCLTLAPAPLSPDDRPRAVSFVEQTRVRFLPLDPAEIDRYLSLIDPLDKAGSYAAQDHPELIIASVEGSWTNVLGLPMERLAQALARDFDIHPPLNPSPNFRC
jgi:septum formation protein